MPPIIERRNNKRSSHHVRDAAIVLVLDRLYPLLQYIERLVGTVAGAGDPILNEPLCHFVIVLSHQKHQRLNHTGREPERSEYSLTMHGVPGKQREITLD